MSGTARFTKLTQNQLEHCRVGLVAEAEACQVGASVIGSDLSLYLMMVFGFGIFVMVRCLRCVL